MNSFMIISCTNAIFNIISSYYAFCSIHFTSEEFCLNNVNYLREIFRFFLKCEGKEVERKGIGGGGGG